MTTTMTKHNTEKVSGSSFYAHSLDELQLNQNVKGIPSRTYDAWIVPEPNNQYDKLAKRVELWVHDDDNSGVTILKVGYLKKNGALYRRLKVNKKKPFACQVKVQGYSVKGLNDSYTIIYD